MKCPKCGQEMIDIKDYCVNCGAKLKSGKNGLSLKGLLIIFLLIIIATLIVCYLIMNYNTNKEIQPYLNRNKTTNIENE